MIIFPEREDILPLATVVEEPPAGANVLCWVIIPKPASGHLWWRKEAEFRAVPIIDGSPEAYVFFFTRTKELDELRRRRAS